MKRTELVQAGGDPLSAMMGAADAATPAAAALPAARPAAAATAGNSALLTRGTSASMPAASPASAASPAALVASSTGVSVSSAVGGSSGLGDSDDIIVDSDRQRHILARQERKEHQPLYVGGGLAAGTPGRTPALSVGSLALSSPPSAANQAGLSSGIGAAGNNGGGAGGIASAAASSSASASAAAHAASPASSPASSALATNIVAASAASSSSSSSSSAATTVLTPSHRRPLAPGSSASGSGGSRSLPRRSRDWGTVPPEVSRELVDDWDSHGRIPGEKSVMAIPDVLLFNGWDDPSSVAHSIVGTLFMTTYQLFVEPTQRRDRLGQAVVAIPLSSMDRIELDKSKMTSGSGGPGGNGGAAGGNNGGSGSGPSTYSLGGGGAAGPSGVNGSVWSGGANHTPPLHYLDIYSKDGRYVKIGFAKVDECKRAFDCLTQYVFPSKEEFLFAFYYKLKTPLPKHLNGWELYDPLEEVARQGISTIPLVAPASLQSTSLRLSWANESYNMCASYPRVFVVPSERFISDIDLLVVAQFRSRGRIPVCTWKHPTSRQTIWRCSQPKVGMNNTRCQEDEKLLSSLTSFAAHGEMFAIYDCRPRFNARANILAGKGFENPDLYRNAIKKIFFMDIQNIHVMREAHLKLTKACQREGPGGAGQGHEVAFLTNVASSGWLSHIATCLKATAEMVKSIDQDKISLLIHCSDGWDRTAQLASLCQLCLDPFYRTTRGFFILIEKDWLSYGHQFARRTGHRDRTYTDDQRSCIFLQWCDSVYQLTVQFPRHFEFNSHLLVTLVHHLYSCRFGTFFYNTDMNRRRNKMAEKTVSVWTYFMCSPAAVAGEFTNQLYCPSGNGAPAGHATTATASAAPPADPDDVGRSSVGRGGGDGSRTAVGTVLYPCWTLKSVRLWSDYFLRWSNEQCEQVPVTNSAGSVAPGGAATPRLVSGDAALQAELRRVHRENTVLAEAAQRNAERVRELELELQQLRYGLSDTTSSGNKEKDKSGAVDAAAANSIDGSSSSSPLVFNASGRGSASVAAAAVAVSAAGVDAVPLAAVAAEDDVEDPLAVQVPVADAAALNALKQRLAREVDVSVREEAEAPEDPRTL